jgi:putative oxidoreductase
MIDNIIRRFANPLDLIGRLLVAYVFVGAGFAKIGGYEHTVAYMESVGLSGGLLPLVILTEVGAGILLALGYQTRVAAIVIAGFSILAAIFFHSDWSVEENMFSFLRNVAITGALLSYASAGVRGWSIDAWREKKILNK